jgi:hypothetical protein
MSMAVLPAGDAESIPSFLLRGPVRESEAVRIETRFSILRSSLVLSGGIGGAISALAFGGYLMIAEGKQEPSASEVHAVVAHPVVSEAPVLAKPDPAPAVQAEAPATEQAPAVQAEAVPEGGPEAPHQVTTTHFDADPSVWTDVRKFSPLPADAVPVLDSPQAESAPAVPRSEERGHHARAEVKPARAKHAGRRGRLSEAAREASRGAPARAADDTPSESDVGGTVMTAAQLRRDRSANPVVNAFAGMFGPK